MPKKNNEEWYLSRQIAYRINEDDYVTLAEMGAEHRESPSLFARGVLHDAIRDYRANKPKKRSK
jgi:hypothetical protein